MYFSDATCKGISGVLDPDRKQVLTTVHHGFTPHQGLKSPTMPRGRMAGTTTYSSFQCRIDFSHAKAERNALVIVVRTGL